MLKGLIVLLMLALLVTLGAGDVLFDDGPRRRQKNASR